jgi:hypothetical protein
LFNVIDFTNRNPIIYQYLISASEEIFLIPVSLVFSSVLTFSQQANWKIAGNKIITPWAEKVNPASPLSEYPRPQMVRAVWKNLNGLWDYNITPKKEAMPNAYAGKILVPFAVESALSELAKRSVKTVFFGTGLHFPCLPL